jgi:HK97 family phage portal protein
VSRFGSLVRRALRWDAEVGWSRILGTSPTDYERHGRNVRELGWKQHPIVHACARTIVDIIAAVPFEEYKRYSDGTTDTVYGGKVGRLMAQPSGATSGMMLRRRVGMAYVLFGNALLKLERPSPRRPPERLRFIGPDRVTQAWLDLDTDEIAAYDWTDLQGKVHARTPVHDIVHFRDLEADDGLFGYPRFASAIRSMVADSEATEYVRQVVTNHGQPGMIGRTKGYRRKEDLDAAESSFNEKFVSRGKRGGIHFINAEDLELTPVGFNLRELEFPDLRRVSREDICAAALVDPRMIGAGSATKDGGLSGEQYNAARFRLIQQTVLPIMRSIEEDLNAWLAPEFGDVYLRFDPDVLSELTEDEAQTSKRGLEEMDRGAITVEEYRELTGRDAAIDKGQRLSLPGTRRIIVAGEAVEATTPQVPPALEPGDEPKDGGKALPGESKTERAAPLSRIVRRGMKLSPDQRAALWAQFDTRAAAEEGGYRRAAELLFDRERQDVRREFNTATRASGEDALLDAILRVILEKYGKAGEYADAWVRRYQDLIAQTFGVAIENVAGSVGVDFTLENPKVQAAIRDRAVKLAEFVTEETAEQISAAVATGRAQGLGMAEIADLVEESVYGPMTESRALRIARTETVGAMNQGEFVTAVESGVLRSKEWLTQGDARVRDGKNGGGNHKVLDGKRIDMGRAFANGCKHPGDRSGPADPSETINCRCTLLFYDEEAPSE